MTRIIFKKHIKAIPIIISFSFIISLFLSCSHVPEKEYIIHNNNGTSNLEKLPEKKWTVAIHLNADNSLHGYESINIEQMKAVSSSNDFNIIIFVDNMLLHNYYYITNGEAKLIHEVDEVNMGDPKVAEDFIDFFTEYFSAERYMWIYWNHGNGVGGISFDAGNGNDYLDGVEQKRILDYFSEKTGSKIDIVGMDACLMASLAVAGQYRDTARYFIASQNVEPAEGWDYGFLQHIKSNPEISARELSTHAANYYNNLNSNQYSDYTISVVNLSKYNDLALALNNFCDASMKSEISPEIFKNLFNSSTSFFYIDSINGQISVIANDLGIYMNNIINSDEITHDIKNKAQTVLDRISDGFVVYNKTGSGINATGISITPGNWDSFKLYEMCRETLWDDFCEWSELSMINSI